MKDHKEIGVEQELFYFDELSPGCCFFLPHGTRIYNRLKDYLANEYWDRGFQEVITPQIAKKELWQISGHWDKYKDDMFTFNDGSGHEYGLKAMNCPLHSLMFRSRSRSYKELPIRLADCGMLHRNEDTGSLSMMFRTRCFQQDDAHIFCRRTQIGDEITNCLDFLEKTYGMFNLDFSIELSTRPDKFIGSIDVWVEAEKQLHDVIVAYSNKSGKPWKVNPGDGAFYGPKIDVHVKDSMGRSKQCATIQLDFNLPSKERFDLKYVNEVGDLEEPVIIHRAIYGSFGRFMGIITEHFQGKWPFWLSPRQIAVLPISEKFLDYAKFVAKTLHKEHYYVDVDESDNTVNKKILIAQQNMYNYILVVGQRETDNATVNVRYRDSPNKKEIKLEELLVELNNIK